MRIRILTLGILAASCDPFLHGVPDKLPPKGGLDDGQPPVITFESPVDGAVVQATITWTVSVEDAVSGIASVELRIDGVRADTLFTAPYSIAWDTTAHAGGDAILEVIATDASARANKAAKAITVRVDNDPPAKPAPVIRAERHSEIEVEWPAVDGAAGYRVQQGSTGMSTTATSYVLTGLDACEHYTITVSALDDAPIPNEAVSDPLAARTRCGGDGTFAVTRYPGVVGNDPRDIVLADFNGDRILDLAIVGSFVDLHVLLGEGVDGRGTGTFGSPARFALGLTGRAIEAADFDADAILDLAIAGAAMSGGMMPAASVLLGLGTNGRGDGAFGPPATTTVILQPTGPGTDVVSADFDRDHILDLAVGFGGGAVILRGGGSDGRGDGSFATTTTIVAFPFGPELSLTAEDFNADGIVDLAAAGFFEIGVALGNGSDGRGDGTFGAASTLPVTGAPGDAASIAAGDFDGDGVLDLAQASAGHVNLLMGNGSEGAGDGTFQFGPTYGGGSDVPALIAADVDRDAILDLIHVGAVLIGRGASGHGDGTFDPAPIPELMGVALDAVAAGDLNADGILDLVVLEESGTLFVAIGGGQGARGDGTFGPSSPVPDFDLDAEAEAESIAGDFDEDGILDLAITADTALWIARGLGRDGQGTGRFEPPLRVSEGFGLASGDFDADSIADLVTGSPTNLAGSPLVLLGNGGGGRGDGTFRVASSRGSDFMRAVAVADFDADAILDVAGLIQPHMGAIYLGGGTKGRGDGTFSRAETLAATDTLVRAVTTGDFNMDGVTDLAVTGEAAVTRLGILLGNGVSGRGNGTFQAAAGYLSSGVSSSLVRGDFNADGIDDLALSGIAVLLGNGADGRGEGTFSLGSEYDVSGADPGTGRIASADVDSDGILDLLALIAPDGLAVLIGNGSSGRGDGTFSSPIFYPITGPPASSPLTVADFDSDGILDVFAGGAILLGQGARP